MFYKNLMEVIFFIDGVASYWIYELRGSNTIIDVGEQIFIPKLITYYARQNKDPNKCPDILVIYIFTNTSGFDPLSSYIQ